MCVAELGYKYGTQTWAKTNAKAFLFQLFFWVFFLETTSTIIHTQKTPFCRA